MPPCVLAFVAVSSVKQCRTKSSMLTEAHPRILHGYQHLPQRAGRMGTDILHLPVHHVGYRAMPLRARTHLGPCCRRACANTCTEAVSCRSRTVPLSENTFKNLSGKRSHTPAQASSTCMALTARHAQRTESHAQVNAAPKHPSMLNQTLQGMQMHIGCRFLITRLACSSPSAAAVHQGSTAVQPEGRLLHRMPAVHMQGGAPVCTSNRSLPTHRPTLCLTLSVMAPPPRQAAVPL